MNKISSTIHSLNQYTQSFFSMPGTGLGAGILWKLKHLPVLKQQVWRKSSKVTSDNIGFTRYERGKFRVLWAHWERKGPWPSQRYGCVWEGVWCARGRCWGVWGLIRTSWINRSYRGETGRKECFCYSNKAWHVQRRGRERESCALGVVK